MVEATFKSVDEEYQQKHADDTKKFNELVTNVNFILLYLSKVEFQRLTEECPDQMEQQEPIQIVYSNSLNQWIFVDELDSLTLIGSKSISVNEESIVHNSELSS